MIFCEIGGQEKEQLNTLAVFVRQLRNAGYDAAIHSEVVDLWDNIGRQQVYDIAPLVTDRKPENGDHLFVVDAQKILDSTLAKFKRRYSNAEMTCTAFGDFSLPQTEIGIRAKVGYALGVEPEIIDCTSGPEPFFTGSVPVLGVANSISKSTDVACPKMLLFGPNLEDVSEQMALKSLARTGKVVPIVMTNAAGKQAWNKAQGHQVACYQFGEVLPDHICAGVNVLVVYQGSNLNYRGKTLVANLARSGAVLMDGSNSYVHHSVSETFIQTAQSVATLHDHLFEVILPARLQISKATFESKLAKSVDPVNVCNLLKIKNENSNRPKVVDSQKRAKTSKKNVVYHPTNGVGLGHAQRCSLIAAEHSKSKYAPKFAAFPSCIPMLQGYGFDATPLVSRTQVHKANFAHDLLNYSRLQSLAADASVFVFDGGYIFDSVYRSLQDQGVPGVWIRRGMWQEKQDNSIPLDREKFFSKVIVPTEAFEELNDTYSNGNHVEYVGPITQLTSMNGERKKDLRNRLSEKYELDFDHLVVTMLGGGVAANRALQLQALCGMMERRERTLHLIVAWPTATLEPVVFDWKNTHITKTHYAGTLAASADLFISAVGYNSFHEVLYNQIPTIFIPQMSAMMDDQQKRAQAAVDRDLAALVEPAELVKLEIEVSAFLDQGKSDRLRAKLSDMALPELGNAMAARIIEGVI